MNKLTVPLEIKDIASSNIDALPSWRPDNREQVFLGLDPEIGLRGERASICSMSASPRPRPAAAWRRLVRGEAPHAGDFRFRLEAAERLAGRHRARLREGQLGRILRGAAAVLQLGVRRLFRVRPGINDHHSEKPNVDRQGNQAGRLAGRHQAG